MSEISYAAQQKMRGLKANTGYNYHKVSMPPGTPPGRHANNDFSFPSRVPFLTRIGREFLCTFFWMLGGLLTVTSIYTDDFWAPGIGYALPLYIVYEVYYGVSINPLISLLNYMYESSPYHIGAVVVQLAGCLGAAGLVYSLVPTGNMLWALTIAPVGYTDMQVLLLEFFIAFGYAWVYQLIYKTGAESAEPLITTKSPQSLLLAAYWLVATATTGGSLHPWKTLSVAIVTGVYTKVWLYVAADFIGYVAASLLFVAAYGTRREID